MKKNWTHSVSNHSLYLYLIYELLLCKILDQYITKYGYYKYFPISCDFFHRILNILAPKIAIYGPIQLGIIANIVS